MTWLSGVPAAIETWFVPEPLAPFIYSVPLPAWISTPGVGALAIDTSFSASVPPAVTLPAAGAAMSGTLLLMPLAPPSAANITVVVGVPLAPVTVELSSKFPSPSEPVIGIDSSIPPLADRSSVPALKLMLVGFIAPSTSQSP
ncbi:MAG TPA: hypothetical protein VGG99_13680 [Acetobacteraceae bacterium]